MTSAATSKFEATALIVFALAIAVTGIFIAFIDDPNLPGPGPAGMGTLLMIVGVVAGLRAARHRLTSRAARTTLAAGVLVAVFAGLLIHRRAVTAPLFAGPRDVPSVVESEPLPQYASAVDRARTLVRAAIVQQNLPGVSVAVAGVHPGALAKVAGLPSVALAKEGLWAEGFGWRDVDTRTPVTPKTRFNIGTAASVITGGAAARLGLTDTGAEPAAEWSPEHIGEPEENPPPFTIVRHTIFRPIGLAPAAPLAGDRATFYVPRSDDNPRRGRRLMYMRDLACCAGTLASYSTASDVVRVGLANGVSINGQLASGMVMSLITRRDDGIAVAVLSNIAHANTSALALKIADAFARQVP